MYGFFASQVDVHFISDEWCEWSDHFCDTYQDFVSSLVNGLLVCIQFFVPESSSCSSDVPVGQVFYYKVLNLSYGLHVIVVIHFVCNFFDQFVVFGDDPSVQFRSFCIWNIEFCRVDVILVGVHYEEVIYVSDCSEELGNDFNQTIFVELSWGPCRRSVHQIPSCSVCTVLIKQLERINCVASGLGHFLSFFVQDQVINQNVLVRSFTLDESGNSHQGVEPSSCLVDTFADEVCRE